MYQLQNQRAFMGHYQGDREGGVSEVNCLKENNKKKIKYFYFSIDLRSMMLVHIDVKVMNDKKLPMKSNREAQDLHRQVKDIKTEFQEWKTQKADTVIYYEDNNNYAQIMALIILTGTLNSANFRTTIFKQN
jgi:hypothetical protein